MTAVGSGCFSRCIKIWVKSSVSDDVCFSHERSVEVKQAQSKEISEDFRGRVVERHKVFQTLS